MQTQQVVHGRHTHVNVDDTRSEMININDNVTIIIIGS